MYEALNELCKDTVFSEAKEFHLELSESYEDAYTNIEHILKAFQFCSVVSVTSQSYSSLAILFQFPNLINLTVHSIYKLPEEFFFSSKWRLQKLYVEVPSIQANNALMIFFNPFLVNLHTLCIDAGIETFWQDIDSLFSCLPLRTVGEYS